MEIRIKTNPKK